MWARVDSALAFVVSLAACGWLLVDGASVGEVVAAAAMVVSRVAERRSLAWALLVSALLITGNALVVLAAVAVPPPGPAHDLRFQGIAALRRAIAAACSPALLLGAVAGAYRFGTGGQRLWWIIGWGPAAVIAVLNATLVTGVGPLKAAYVIGAAGMLLALELAPETRVAVTADIPQAATSNEPVPAGRRRATKAPMASRRNVPRSTPRTTHRRRSQSGTQVPA